MLLNAGAALYATGKAESLREGVSSAAESVDSGAAAARLAELRPYPNPSRIDGCAMFLDTILRAKRAETARRGSQTPVAVLQRRAATAPATRDFLGAIERPGLGVIAEIKRRSPSKGDLCPELDRSPRRRSTRREAAWPYPC